ncbi:MAG: response regulator [Rhodobacteraceae bacterium]|nr:response regulator [Paracoccaceae bacterium]
MVDTSQDIQMRRRRIWSASLRRGWRFKLSASIGMLVALFVGLLIYINASTQLDFVQKRYLDGATSLGTIVREVSLPYLVDDRPAQLDIIYEEWSEQPNVLSLEFIDEDNFLLVTGASSGGDQFLTKINDPLVNRAREAKADVIEEHGDYLAVAFPVTIGTRYLGTIRLMYGRSVANEEVRVVVRKNLQLGALITIAGLLLSIWLASTLTAPLRKLETASLLAANGDLSQKISIHSNDEVGSLSRSFNIMLDNLSERVETLEATKQELGASKRELEHRNSLLQQAVAEAEDAKTKAETAEAAKSDFVARMSHEIRTPLNGVLGMTELLSETDMSTGQADILNTIRTSGESLLAVVNDILDFSKIGSGHMSLRSETFDLIDLIDSIAQSFAAQSSKAGLELVTRIAPDVPLRIVGDAIRLKQVLTNLVGNALKFTDDGFVQISARLGQSEPGNALLQFDIEDSGCGIQTEMIATLFDEFTQVDVSHSRTHEGTGLGLAISRGFVDLMGGKIWARSEEGIGTVFSFVIPLVKANDEVLETDVAKLDLEGRQVWVALRSGVAATALYERFAGWNADVIMVTDGSDSEKFEMQTEGSQAPIIVIDQSLIQTYHQEIRDWRSRWEHDQGAQVIAFADLGSTVARDDSLEKLTDRVVLKPILMKQLAEIVAWPNEKIEKPKPLEFRPDETQPIDARVLLVDDNATNRKIVELMLKRQGVSYETAINGREAVTLFSEYQPDIVLMDVSMPVMNGYEATQAIRVIEHTKGGQPCQIIGLTAHSSPEDRKACLEAGMDDHIAKPVKLDVLRRLIG